MDNTGVSLAPAQQAVVAGQDREAGRAQFWEDMIALGGGIVYQGVHYRTGPENAVLKGYGGRRYRLTAKDGAVSETTNLWCQGRIPEAYRDRLPDTLAMLEVQYGLSFWVEVEHYD